MTPYEQENTVGSILLIEDDPTDAKLLMRAFSKIGVQNPIYHLSNGEKALAFFHRLAPYDDVGKYAEPILILLDLKLPDIPGLNLLNVVRARSELRRVPVVVISGNESPTTIQSAYDAGAASYLLKSYDQGDIERIARSVSDYWLHLNRTSTIVLNPARN